MKLPRRQFLHLAAGAAALPPARSRFAWGRPIRLSQCDPGKVSTASGGNGTPNHMSGELFKMLTGVNMVHVPYRGAAPALTDLLGGQLQVMFDAVPSSIQHIRTGRLRALAVTTAVRSEALPNIPTVGDFVPGYESNGWVGVGAPKNTPAGIIETLNTAFNAALAEPKVKARLAGPGRHCGSGFARRLQQADCRRN